MAHIVILGAAIGGLPAAFEFRGILEKQHEITVINANNYFQFVPSNPWLDPANEESEKLGELLCPAAPELFEVYPVSHRVNNPVNNDQELLKAVSSISK